jgi:2-oxo-4-hydroxy-4-carboxy-5-ureidoimidazoline decarboxylase
MTSLTKLNQMDQDDFVAVLGGVFEHTPAIAGQVWNQRPFTSVDALHRSMTGDRQCHESG